MGLFNKLKQLFKKETDRQKVNIKLKEEILLQVEFFKKPQVLILLILAALLFLNKLRKKNSKSTIELAAIVHADPIAKQIIKITKAEINNDAFIDAALMCCYNQTAEEVFPNIPDNADANTILQIIGDISDIDVKTTNNKFNKLKNWLKTYGNTILSYGYLLYYIIDMIIDIYQNYELPSIHRTKYIQKLLRNTYGIMKSEYTDSSKETQAQLKPMLAIFKQIDNILIAVGIMTALYVKNRQKLQKRSKQTLSEISQQQLCQNINLDASIGIVTPISFNSRLANISCAVNTDDVLVPQLPIEDKLCNISCEVISSEKTIADITDQPDLATIAIIRDLKSTKMKILTNKDSRVDQKSLLATIGDSLVISPVVGYIDNLTPTEIVIRDISDTDISSLDDQIKLMSDKFLTLNQIKLFLKDYYIPSLYPLMLKTSKIDKDYVKNPLTGKNIYADISSGIDKQFNIIIDSFKNLKKDYEKEIKDITGSSNVKAHCDNESLDKLKEQIDNKNDTFYENLSLIGGKSNNLALTYKSKEEEYQLLEYYLYDLGVTLNQIENPNDIEKTYINKINEFAAKRYVIDGYSENSVKQKINDSIEDIKGTKSSDWFANALRIYNSKKQISDVKDWLTGMANNNKKLDSTEKISSVNKTLYLFNFYLHIQEANSEYKNMQVDLKQETGKEADFINSFFKDLWKQYNNIPDEIMQIQKNIDSLSMFQTYSITTYNDQKARLYIICDNAECYPEDDDYFSKSKEGYNSMKYWLKYCAYATAASVVNPVTGWSTGWIFPAPILFPVIYIPIKPIMTKYGFVVIGLSICGIYIFPWVLFANLSSEYAIPAFNPMVALKNEIEALKKEISNQSMNFKRNAIKNEKDKLKQKIDNIDDEIKITKKNIEINRANKPKFITTFKSSIQDVETYSAWNQQKSSLKEYLHTLKFNKWQLTKTWSVLDGAYRLGTPIKDPLVKEIEKMEKQINDKLDKLSQSLTSLNTSMASLPISMAPDTANFGITIKNPKPINNIADELDQNVNNAALNKITDRFALKNKDLLSTNYDTKLSSPTSIMNFNAYKNILAMSMLTMIDKDPFPKFEMLKPTNLPWIKFLMTDFVTSGAQTFGFPGMPPFPIT